METEKRKKEILDAVGNNVILVPMVEDMVSLEGQLDYLRTLPKIKVHPKDPTRQKATVAARQYKELLQQYANIVKIMLRASGAEDSEEDSPLRRWMNEHLDA